MFAEKAPSPVEESTKVPELKRSESRGGVGVGEKSVRRQSSSSSVARKTSSQTRVKKTSAGERRDWWRVLGKNWSMHNYNCALAVQTGCSCTDRQARPDGQNKYYTNEIWSDCNDNDDDNWLEWPHRPHTPTHGTQCTSRRNENTDFYVIYCWRFERMKTGTNIMADELRSTWRPPSFTLCRALT